MTVMEEKETIKEKETPKQTSITMEELEEAVKAGAKEPPTGDPLKDLR